MDPFGELIVIIGVKHGVLLLVYLTRFNSFVNSEHVLELLDCEMYVLNTQNFTLSIFAQFEKSGRAQR